MYSTVVQNFTEEVKPASAEEISNYILDRISEGNSLQRISDTDDKEDKSISSIESSVIESHNQRNVVELVRDNQLLDTGDYSNAATPGELYIGIEKIASYQHSHNDDSESEFFGQVKFSGDEVVKIEAEVKKICDEFYENISAPVDRELSNRVLSKLVEMGGSSETIYHDLVKQKIVSVDDLLATGLLNENKKQNLMSSTS